MNLQEKNYIFPDNSFNLREETQITCEIKAVNLPEKNIDILWVYSRKFTRKKLNFPEITAMNLQVRNVHIHRK